MGFVGVVAIFVALWCAVALLLGWVRHRFRKLDQWWEEQERRDEQEDKGTWI